MTKQQSSFFTIKCECSVYKNGLLITTKKKSKLSNLVLKPVSKNITIMPLNAKDQCIVFELKRLKHIHRKFISQGKITFEFSQEIEKSNSGNKILVQENKVERLSQIFVEAASAENLQLLIKKIIDLKKEIKPETKSAVKIQKQALKQQITENKSRIIAKTQNIQSKNKQSYPKMQRFSSNLAQRKRDPFGYNQSVRKYQEEKSKIPVSRKELMRQALNPKKEEQIFIQKKTQRLPVQILELPSILLQKIFQFTKMDLTHRLISKKFDSFVLRNIVSLSFKDEVDQETFNKLAKFTINVRGRLKNVRSLELIDLHDDRELEKNRAKSFYLGEWKQMSKKNMQQLKGLRIHTLQMPYNIKFDFQNIYGIRLKELHLISRQQVTTPNSLISDQNLVYIFKHVKELQCFSIPYINSSVLQDLSTVLKEKARQLKTLNIGSVNQNCKGEESWFLLHIYQQLRSFKVERVLRGGIMCHEIRHKFTFPLYIEQLEIGSVVSQQTIHSFPNTLIRLKLLGQQYYNNDIASVFFCIRQIYLPYLKILDLTQCTMIRPSLIDLLEKCSGLKIITSWDRQDVEYWKNRADEKGVLIVTIKGMIWR